VQLLHSTHRANQAASMLFTEHAKDANASVTIPQAIVLDAIRANDGATQAKLVEETGIDRSTLADICKRLKARGLLDRRRTKADARAYAVRLTPQGNKQLDLAKAAAAKAEKALVAKFPGVKHLANGKG
jgi:DNA-binding MarR family transcriptional regulator